MNNEYFSRLQRVADAALDWQNIGGINETAKLESEVRELEAYKDRVGPDDVQRQISEIEGRESSRVES